MKLEDDLRAALERIEAPSGFATRVVARARLQQLAEDGRSAPSPQPPARRSWAVVLAAAASLIVATSSGLVFLDRQKQADAERARGLAVQALRLASAELQQIQSRVVNRRTAPASGERPSQNPSEQRP
jgi:hypothetical protein